MDTLGNQTGMQKRPYDFPLKHVNKAHENTGHVFIWQDVAQHAQSDSTAGKTKTMFQG